MNKAKHVFLYTVNIDDFVFQAGLKEETVISLLPPFPVRDVVIPGKLTFNSNIYCFFNPC